MSVTNIHSSPADTRAYSGVRERLQSSQPDAGPAKGADAEQNRQNAFQLVQQTLAMGYEKLAAASDSSADRFARFEPLSAEKVAGNILGFIERRLQKDASEGASREQLRERLEQGLAGFKKGFAEAREQLQGLRRFTPTIEADINDTRDRVLSGVESLRQRILDGAFNDPKDAGAVARTDDDTRSPEAYRYQQARASSFSFQLTTAEGDRVSIQARSSAAVSLSEGGGGSSLSASASRAVGWSVQGDLNEKERSAIESLLGGVDRLAEQFFAGDLAGAMASAMELGYDREQVARFSLNLVRSDISRVSESYGRIGRAGADAASSLQERLAPMGDFLRNLETTLADAKRISPRPWEPLLDAGERMAEGDRGEHAEQARSLRDFMARMLETLTTDLSTHVSDGRTPATADHRDSSEEV